MKCISFPLIMKGTSLFASVLTIILFACNGFRTDGPVGACAITALTVAFHFLMRLVVGTVIPNRFHSSNPWFQVKPWEQKLYRKLKIKQWKQYLPTYDSRAFSLTHSSPAQILASTRHAEIVHEIIAVLSFLPVFLFSPVFGAFPVFLITSIVAAAIDLVFVALQRSNRPRLERLLQKRSARS